VYKVAYEPVVTPFPFPLNRPHTPSNAIDRTTTASQHTRKQDPPDDHLPDT